MKQSVILVAGFCLALQSRGVGIVPNGTRDCTTMLLDSCSQGHREIQLADGVYDFYTPSATYMRFHVSHHEDNDFEPFDVPYLYALSAEDVVWRNNRIRMHDRYRGWQKPELIQIGC